MATRGRPKKAINAILDCVEAVLTCGNTKLQADFLKVLHQYLEQIALERLLSGEYEAKNPSEKKERVKLALVGKDTPQETDSLLSKEFLQHLNRGEHRANHDRLK